MGLQIVWTQTARERLVEITTYISQHDADAAERLWRRLADATAPLSDHPYLYRQEREPGTRELVVHPNYIIVYRVLADAVEVVTILHARRRYPGA